MAISLQKGQKIDLTKGNKGLKNLLVGLGWDINQYDSNAEFDLDASAFIVGASGKCRKDEDFIFYNNLIGDNNCVEHTGDNRTGEGEGDDEVIYLNLDTMPNDVDKVVIAVTIFNAEELNLNFGQVSNAFIRIVDRETNQELMRFDLGEDFSVETGVVAGEIYRHSGEWKFNAVGMGYQGGLNTLCKQYGLEV